MRKNFAITLIFISTSVYLTVFVISMQNHTGFFDEILNQLNRLNVSINNREEVNQSKLVLRTILENRTPPAIWLTFIDQQAKANPYELFYTYKVWMIKKGLTLEDILGSYPIYISQQKNFTLINMRYGPDKPVIQFPFRTRLDGKILTGLFFPINEPPFSADLNNDNLVDQKDVELAQ